mgnify:CR=1 FL=1
MVVGILRLTLHLPEPGSLKSKRHLLRSALDRVRSRFPVAIAEVGDNDLWRRARIGFSVVGNDKPYINGKVDHILSFIEKLGVAEVIRSRIEIVSFDDLIDEDEIETGKYD